MGEDAKKTLTPKLRFPEFRKRPGWAPRRIGDILEQVERPVEMEDDQEYSLVTVKRRYGGVVSREKLFGRAIKVKSQFTVKRNDFLISKRQIVHNACGIVPADLDGCIVSNEYAVLAARKDTDIKFFEYFAQQSSVSNSFLKSSVGIVIEKMLFKLATWLQFEFPVPDIAEQRKIADCLTSLDELIAAQGRKVEALKAHKKGLMQQLFPREGETLPRLRFPEFRNAPAWEEKKLDELAKRGTGHTPNKGKPEYYNGGIKWVSLADSKRLDNGLISETEIEISQEGIDNSSAVIHPAGTVILSRDAGVGKSAITGIPMAVSQHFIVWICNEGQLSNWFLYFVLQNLKPVFDRIATGSTIKTIGMPFFKELRVIVPSFEEQQRIADCLSALDAQITAESQKLDALKLHKRGLMQQLFPAAEQG
jgi:type I restriction enzyme S subunit